MEGFYSSDRDRWFCFTCTVGAGQEHCLHQRDRVKNKQRMVKKCRVVSMRSYHSFAGPFFSFTTFIGFVDEKEKDRIILCPGKDEENRGKLSKGGSVAVFLNY